MDRLEAMELFVAVVERGTFASAARHARRSPASVTRAVAQLEAELGQPLLRRTTRRVRLTWLGESYVAACRKILTDVAGARQLAARDRQEPRGTLAVTAPVVLGHMHVRPVVDAFLARHREVCARLVLVDRVVDLVDEGIDVAIRIGELADSSLIAVRVGEVARIACASRHYLEQHRAPRRPSDLAQHDLIAFSQVTPLDTWTFGKQRVSVAPRLVVNTAEAAIDSALDGRGIACVLSYQVEAELRSGRLVRVLADLEPPPVPVHVVYGAGSVLAAKVRAFVDLAVPRLRKAMSPAGRRGSLGA